MLQALEDGEDFAVDDDSGITDGVDGVGGSGGSGGGGGEKRTRTCSSFNPTYIISQTWFFAVMATLTLYALFGDDIRLCFTTKESDPIFYAISLLALLTFLLEIGLNCVGQTNYIWPMPSLYFWIDLAAAISLWPEIGWLWDPLLIRTLEVIPKLYEQERPRELAQNLDALSGLSGSYGW